MAKLKVVEFTASWGIDNQLSKAVTKWLDEWEAEHPMATIVHMCPVATPRWKVYFLVLYTEPETEKGGK